MTGREKRSISEYMDLHVGRRGLLTLFIGLLAAGCQLDGTAPVASRLLPPDASTDSSTDAFIDAGMFARLGAGCELEVFQCEAGECADGTTCIPDGCGRLQCQASGLACLDAADCPTTSACVDGPLGSVCVPSGACVDLRDCPAGHGCEAGLCLDRRRACEFDDGCAEGTYCERDLAAGMPFCAPSARPCASHAACRPGASCVDPDGDGHGDCRLD